MILGWILGLTVVASVLTLVVADSTDLIVEAAKAVVRGDRGRCIVALGCLLPLVPTTIVVLWVIYAAQVGEWRFAAIEVIPVCCGIVGGYLRAVRKRRRLARVLPTADRNQP